MARVQKRRRRTWDVDVLPRRILLPLASREEAEVLLPFAQALMDAFQARLIVLHVVAVPEGRPLSAAAADAMRIRERIDDFLEERGLSGTQVLPIVRVAREVWEGIWETVQQERADLLILGWESEALPATALGDLGDPRLASPPCDVIFIRPGEDLKGGDGWQRVRHILLPLRGGPRATLALRVANALAEATEATVTMLHVAEKQAQEETIAYQQTVGPALRELAPVTRAVTSTGDVVQSILDESVGHQVIIMGAPTRRVRPNGWMGPILEQVARNTRLTLIIVKERAVEPAERPLLPERFAEEERLRPHPITVIVDKWFAENTFHSREFEDIERLVQLKEEQGLTISLGLPALNEEETVGNVIRTVKTALMDQFPLLDEIVLIDSGSVDYTREIAASLGIPVYIHQEVLTQYGAYHGKGEALWKSLYILNGDIIAWIDTDIKNIHPRFVYGILGPLLKNPRIMYVKGFYRRPLREGNRIIAGGGGRVTELTARPLLNLFFPELSGLIQPLAGEYAGRREALEKLPFFTGYGVETGLLIDMLEAYGLHAIAQVDLLERVHHNQPLPSLSKMAFAIIQVVVRRLEDRHKIRLLEDINKTMNLIRYGPNRYFLETVEIRERERPPMITIPEYRRKRGIEDADTVPAQNQRHILSQRGSA